MKIIPASYVIETPCDLLKELPLLMVERAGRTCYKSEEKMVDGSAEKFIKTIIKSGHESVIEHFSLTVRFVSDRGVSHELVRHRLASFSQESTRYCNYSTDKFGNEITVIKPCFWKEGSPNFETWRAACELAEKHYFYLLNLGAKPQEARSILPNSLKTEIVVTANLREWRLILKQRTSPKAHPQMRELMIPLLLDLKTKLPVFFEDIEG